jgi:Terpene cyclase DEP1
MATILNNKHYFYLLLAILGGGLTFYFAVLGIIEHKGDFDSIEFITSTWIDSYYAKSLTFDFWTGTIAGTFFILLEGLRLKIKRIWLYLLLTVFVGYAFGFPLFLFIRELQLRSQYPKH